MRFISKLLLALAGLMTLPMPALFAATSGNNFDECFSDSTLRIDVSFPGGETQILAMLKSPGWYGRRVNLTDQPFNSEMDVIVTDKATGDTIYRDTRFVEFMWRAPHLLPPAVTIVDIPLPHADASLEINYFPDRRYHVKKAHIDLPRTLLRDAAVTGIQPLVPVTTLREADRENAVYLAIIAEGFNADEMDTFRTAAVQLTDSLLSTEAFAPYASRFNVVAVEAPSADSGISRPSKGIKRKTALGAHYDSAGMDRLITIPDATKISHLLTGVPAAHVIILANSDIYGGSGSFNNYAIGFCKGDWWTEVVTHEFGHSFIGLGDEYEEGFPDQYSPDIEPEDPNLTTLHDFSNKWQDLIDEGKAGLIEGGGYCPTGVWRGCESCLMRTVQERRFCPVCVQAIGRRIDFLTTPRSR